MVLVLLALVAACAVQPWSGFPTAVRPELTWPGPPLPARVGFVAEIRGHRDLFEEGGGLRTIGRWLSGPADSGVIRPYAVALHGAGGLLVTDPGRCIVHFFDGPRRRYVALGAELEGGLPSPVGVAALPDGRILVSDSRLGRVLIFDRDGAPQGTFAGPPALTRPAGLAVHPARGEVLIADVAAHRVRVFDLAGRPLREFGGRGDAPGQFNFPTHIAVGADGRTAVCDSMNFRVQVFAPDGAPLRTIGELGDAPGQFAKPKGVALDREGRLIVVEGLHDAVQFFSAEGELLLSIGRPGQAPGEFWLPAGVAYDPATDLLFVADSYNARVQVFRMLGGAGE
ncbi:MAG TPA: 6-bladed beta-propeller [Candidatus Sumerlaeota bacterium]|nr:6-bladed beta-propeller [Candidatus Sumerlaeota bacterium]